MNVEELVKELEAQRAENQTLEILSTFRGISMHDSLSSYLQYGCMHGLSLVQYLRDRKEQLSYERY